jgi:hypothetical protein
VFYTCYNFLNYFDVVTRFGFGMKTNSGFAGITSSRSLRPKGVEMGFMRTAFSALPKSTLFKISRTKMREANFSEGGTASRGRE